MLYFKKKYKFFCQIFPEFNISNLVFAITSIGFDNFFEEGMIFAGMSPDNILPETLELNDHPWFIAVQFHPELKSRPFQPHPLFVSFINASLNQSRLL